MKNNGKSILIAAFAIVLCSCGTPQVSGSSDNSVDTTSVSLPISGSGTSISVEENLPYAYKNTIVNYTRDADGYIEYAKTPYAFKDVYSYYSSVNGLKGNDLKKGLYELIRGHEFVKYDGASNNWKAMYRIIDADPKDPTAINMTYSGVMYGETQFDREHIWAKNLGFTDYKNLEPGVDLHNLHPALAGINSYRGTLEFDNVPSDGVLNTYYGFRFKKDYPAFEPALCSKGDIARTIFYMAVRYEGLEKVDGVARALPELELFNGLQKGLVDGVNYFGNVETLLQWNKEDPVDQAELNRNEIIYKDYQHNRNPFIDHPEYADYIFNANYQNHTASNMNPVSGNSAIPYPANSGSGDIVSGTKIVESIFTGTTSNVGSSYASNEKKDFTVQDKPYYMSYGMKSGSFVLGFNTATDVIDQVYYSAISGMTPTTNASVLAMKFDNESCNGILFNIAEFYPSTYPNYLGNFAWYILESTDEGVTYSSVKSGTLSDVKNFQIAHIRQNQAKVRYALVIKGSAARLSIVRVSTFANATLKSA